MNDKSLFREMAKKVHPDTSSEFASGAKMREVIANKNRPYELLRLVQQWGLNADGSFDKFNFDKKAGFNREVYETVVGAIVRHEFTYKRKINTLRGVIIGIREITRGQRSGGREFKIYDFEKNEIWTMKTMEKDPFTIVGMADSNVVNQGQQKVDFNKKQKKAIANTKQAIADAHFEKLGIKKNKRYASQGMQVLINYRNSGPKWEDLIRTTPKSVYIRCYGYKNDERRINVSVIRDIRSI